MESKNIYILYYYNCFNLKNILRYQKCNIIINLCLYFEDNKIIYIKII